MPVSANKLVDIINNKIVAGGQDVIDLARLYGSTQALSGVNSVANTSSLPAASDNTGRFIYVEDIGAYRYSDGTQWTNDYDTTRTTLSAELFLWGRNNIAGPIGDGTTTNKCSPVREFCSASDWCQVSVGEFHTSAIKTSGQLWTWGAGYDGRLGDGTATNKCSPVREFCSATDWCQVSVGAASSGAVKTSGELWVWGDNGFGRLGDGTLTDRCSPVREFCSATDWCQVSVGTFHTAAVKTSGQIWAAGYNSFGQLGDGTTTNKCSLIREYCSATDWCQVSVNGRNAIAVKTSGEIWAWGWNCCGSLGDGTTTTRTSPVREFCSATDWCQVALAECAAAAAVKTSGELWTWGINKCGQLGDGTITNKCSPVREFCSATDWCQVGLGRCSTGAIKTSGQIWMWGDNYMTNLGDGTAITRCSPVREFCSATNWCTIGVGVFTTAAIKATFKGFNEP